MSQIQRSYLLAMSVWRELSRRPPARTAICMLDSQTSSDSALRGFDNPSRKSLSVSTSQCRICCTRFVRIRGPRFQVGENPHLAAKIVSDGLHTAGCVNHGRAVYIGLVNARRSETD